VVVLGIDPGLKIAGFAVVAKDGVRVGLLDYGVLTQCSSLPVGQRVRVFYDFFKAKIEQFSVTHIALETPFLGKNAHTFLKLGYLRGVVYLLVSQYNVSLREFSPCEIKLGLTGFGGSTKEQVARVLLRLFPALTMPKRLDSTDALAIALCGLWRPESPRL
jgi:crossover junction endodeoxyribonuclease RuvC